MKKILVVEDNRDYQKVALATLSSEIIVEVASTYEEAVGFLTDCDGPLIGTRFFICLNFPNPL